MSQMTTAVSQSIAQRFRETLARKEEKQDQFLRSNAKRTILEKIIKRVPISREDNEVLSKETDPEEYLREKYSFTIYQKLYIYIPNKEDKEFLLDKWLSKGFTSSPIWKHYESLREKVDNPILVFKGAGVSCYVITEHPLVFQEGVPRIVVPWQDHDISIMPLAGFLEQIEV